MSSLKDPKTERIPRAIAEDVEPRILYSADTGVIAYAPTDSNDSVQVQYAQSEPVANQTQVVANRLVVLDGALPELDLLIDDLQQQRNAGAPITILLIDSNGDGLSQLTQFLESNAESFTELHIVSHGDDARFELGSLTVDESVIRARASEFAQWDSSLADGADLLIYGCDFSSSSQGEALANSLSTLTGADVASSVDDTGHASLAANWTLESTTGPVDAQQLFSNRIVQAWQHELSVIPAAPGDVQLDVPGADDPTLDSEAGARQVDSNGTTTVVVWELNDEIYFRVMDANDPTTGTPTAIQNDPVNPIDRFAPSVAIAPNGDFLVVWTSVNQDDQNTGTQGVYAQRFDSTGTPVARPTDAYAEIGGAGNEYVNPYEFRINPHAPGTVMDSENWDQGEASVVSTMDDQFFVSWTSEEDVAGVGVNEVRLTRFLANGMRHPIVQAVNVYPGPLLDTDRAVLATNPANGDLYLAAEVYTANGGEIRLLSIDNGTGLANAVLTTINPPGPVGSTDSATGPRLDVNASGQWALAARWDHLNQTRVYHSDIGGTTNPELVNARVGNSLASDIAIRDNGNVIVASQRLNFSGPSTSQDIAVTEYRSSGEFSATYAVHSYDDNVQQNPALALHGTTATVVWDGTNAGDSDAIMLHNMAVVEPAAILTPDATITNETGTQVNVAVTLSAPPIAPVTVTATVSDATEGQIVGTSTLTFDITNWNLVQTIVIEGVADGIVDPDTNYDLEFSLAGSVNGLFQFAPDQTLIITNQNTDTPVFYDSNLAANQVIENAVSGTTIGITASTNVPATTFQIDPISPASAVFAIDTNTGVITVIDSTSLDAESNLPNPVSIPIPVIATSGAWSQTVTFIAAITDFNDVAPVISPTTLSVPEGQLGALSPVMAATDGDITPNTLTWSLTAPAPYASHVSIDATTGVISVDTAFDFEDPSLTFPIPLTVTVTDGVNPVSTTVNLTVTNIDDEAPVITSTVQVTAVENDSGFSAQMTATDVDTTQAGLYWTVTGGTADPYFKISPTGVITPTGTAFDYEALAGGPLQLDIRVTDGQHADTHSLIINLTDVNDESPVITTSQTFSVPEVALNSTLVGTIAFTDADLVATNPAPTFTLIATMVGGLSVAPPFTVLPTGAINVSDNSQLDYNLIQAYQLQVQIDDGVNPPTMGSVNIDVTDVNYLPSGVNASVTTAEDTPYVFSAGQFSITDPDAGDSLSEIQIVSVPTVGSLTAGGVQLDTTNASLATPYSVSVGQLASLQYTPGANLLSTQSFDFFVVDQAGGIATTANTMQIAITPVNDAPIYPDGPVGVTSVPENVAVSGPINVYDIDDSLASLTYQIMPSPDGARFAVDAAGVVTFAAQDYENPVDANLDNGYEFTIRTTDPGGLFTDQSWTVNITDVSDWLYFNPTGTMNMPEDTVATVGPGAFVIADALTSSSLAVTLDAGLTEMSLGTVNGLSFQVGDGSSDTLMTFSGSLADVNAAISAITVTPPSNLTGPVNINASVVDGDRSDTATLTINVLPVNDAPQITGPAQVNVTAGASAAVTTSMFTATDVDNVAQDLQFMLVTSPPSGQLLLDGVVIGAGGTFTQAQLAAGQITFTSLGGTDSTEQFTVEVRDPAGATDTQQIVVETTGGNAPPPPSDPGGSSDPQSNDPSDDSTDPNSPVVSVPPGDTPSDPAQPGSPAQADSGTSSEKDAGDGAIEEARPKPQIILAYQISYQNTDYEGYRVSDLQTEYETVAQTKPNNRPDFGFSSKFEMTDFRQSMNALEKSMNFGVQLDRQFVASTAVVSTGMSIGYVLWLMRGGALLSSIIASMPAWRSIDPLPVLATLDSADDGQSDDDSLEAMLEKSPPTAPAEVAEETE